MMNICIVFVQFERETIQKRVTDAYYSRRQHGFRMSGAAPYDFQLEPTTIEGIRTKMMKHDPETADIAKLMFEMYSQTATSFEDTARYFADEGIPIQEYGKAKGDYFLTETCASKNKKITRTSEGLYCHHIDEDKAIMLSTDKFAIKKYF